jgi:RNase H-fold protein (predicted Holliday junction resolvase)
VRAVAEALGKELNLPCIFENEICTTRMASAQGKGNLRDASAAAIILQSYLEKRNQESGIRT